MRKSKELSPAATGSEFVPENYFVPLDLNRVFGRMASVEIDIGCGDGAFLVALASQNPERNFLGIERLLGRARCACRKIAQQKLDNARVIRVESSYAIRYLLPPASVAVFYLMFPDPWPKRRHQRRRIITEEFLGSIRRALLPYGLLRIATDQYDYFTEIQRAVNQRCGFVVEAFRGDAFNIPTTTFEKRFRDQRLEIHRLALRKVWDVR
jgi:tRNA (guanine-N7-)-methyltransferase